jgi:cbb3-type cytochrome oxidase subunit 3
MTLLAHGGAGGLVLEVLPIVVIGVLWFAVWRRSKRADEQASAAPRPGDEARVEQDGG